LLRGVTPVHEEGEKTPVLATDVAGQALQLSLVIFPSGAVVFRKAWILGTSGMMPYESKSYALEERGVRCMASQCEPPSVWGSALTMRVQGFRIEPDDGNKSEGKTSRKEVTSRRVHRI
jgi:hypothetical protein